MPTTETITSAIKKYDYHLYRYFEKMLYTSQIKGQIDDAD